MNSVLITGDWDIMALFLHRYVHVFTIKGKVYADTEYIEFRPEMGDVLIHTEEPKYKESFTRHFLFPDDIEAATKYFDKWVEKWTDMDKTS